MIQIANVKAPIDFTDQWLLAEATRRLETSPAEIKSVCLLKKSLDARRRDRIHYVLTLGVEAADETAILEQRREDSNIRRRAEYQPVQLPAWTGAHSPVIVGSGPAGLFAALTLARAGANPLLLERGGDVDERQTAVRRFWDGGALDPENNVQFGEGGAGTFSDGKLTTGTKDPRIWDVLHTLHQCGAPEEILYEAKPHVGTDRLRQVVRHLREEIKRLGGRVEFHAKFTEYHVTAGRISHAVYVQGGREHRIPTDHIILATGHSARDVFQLLCDKGVALAQKPFSVGVRIEHTQAAINKAMYGDGCNLLPAADYKLTAHLEGGRSVYTFCMCPGGLVVASSSEPGGVVTNGMSHHARDGANANSALLVGVSPEEFGSEHPLAGIAFQRELERRAYELSGQYLAPAVTVGEFLTGKPQGFSTVRPSYLPGVIHGLPDHYLPPFVCDALRAGLVALGKKLRGFDHPDAILTGPETRSSSPVRILRDETGCSVNLPGLYPVGEGAGYAGGIISAAVDGIKTAEHVLSSE